MADLENELHTAWMHVAARLSDDPHDLARRIARRRRAVLVRPPRAWCLALRASDSRLANVATILPAIRDIDDSTTDSQLTLPAGRATRGVTATDTVSSPCHPLTLSPCHPQHVSLTPAALRTLCAPVRLDAPGDTLDAVAKKLGTTPIGLRNARLNNIFRVRHVKGLAGRRGRPVPLLYIDRPLDPAARNFAEPDPAWIWTATYLVGRIPADFAQTLTRVEHYRSHVSRTRYAEHVHPEARDGSAPPRKRRYLPPPEPDPVWYKWSRSGHFLGDDPTNWRKSPQDLGERPPRFLPKPRRGKAQRRPGSSSQGSLHFNGHQWLCPVCGKTCRTIYYPIPRLNLLDLRAPGDRKTPGRCNLPPLAQLVEIPQPIDGFACWQCHQIKGFSRVDRNAWNELISYLTGGLLYGREVPRPSWLTRNRKLPFKPRVNAKPALRRQRALELLMQGRTLPQIAAEMKITRHSAESYIIRLYRRHGVRTRRELARKLGFTLPPSHPSPPYYKTFVHLLRAGLPYADIARKLGLKLVRLYEIAYELRRRGHDLPKRPPQANTKRAQVRRHLLAGLSDGQIAAKLGISKRAVSLHVHFLRRSGFRPPFRRDVSARRLRSGAI